jgi:tetratricopeptide (TPR) repeat protein
MLDNLSGENLKEEFKTNKTARMVTYAVGGVVVLVLGYFAYRSFIWKPANEKSTEVGYMGLNYADIDSTELAIDDLRGVVKKYDGKQGGEVAQFVMARQLMEKGEFQKALDELKGVDVEDTYVRVHALGLQGDCLSEIKKYDDAVSKYKDAADMDDNNYTTPQYLFKAALLTEKKLEDPTAAAKMYQQIKDNYLQFSNVKQIDRYIERAKNKTVK